MPSSRIATGGTGGSVAWAVNHMPPDLEVDFGQTLVTRTPRLRVHGRATDDRRVRDLYVFVGSRKVFYRSNRGNENPRQLSFDTEVPLAGGINYVTVFARESPEFAGRKTVLVRRRPVAVAQKMQEAARAKP